MASERFQSIDPATGTHLVSFATLAAVELEAKLAAASAAAKEMRATSLASRCALLRRLAVQLEVHHERLARLAVAEMGKTLRAARSELDKCIDGCRYYADEAPRMLADRPLDRDDAYVRYLPLGPILLIMPWNFPYWQVLRSAVPALAAGNVVLLKPAPNVPQCALALGELIVDALAAESLPRHAFELLFTTNAQTADVVADLRIRAVSLTGSERAGAEVAATAGRALKKLVLELGGSDPFIVLPSADLARAAQVAVQSRVANNGQACTAAKRFIVHDAVYDAFEAQLLTAFGALTVGPPLDEGTDVGPLSSSTALELLEAQVARCLAAGAQARCGGRRVDRPGSYFAPTVLAVPVERAGAPPFREELFGPVALLFRVRTLEEALALANDTPFGLGSAVWSTEPAEIARCVDTLDTGMTFINGLVASDPRLPFGGTKRSGIGRELGAAGIYELVNQKTVVVGESNRGDDS